MTDATEALSPCPFCGDEFAWGELTGLDLVNIRPDRHATLDKRTVKHPKNDCILSGQRWWGDAAHKLNRRALLAGHDETVERCAQWHDKRAHDTPDVFEMEFHQVSAKAIRALRSKP